ncbi:citrate/2-methylcitrate synthase [uncultured Robinsoniella sp.]|uniref:citrate/2-methylcitrate synthase n=1 Tax=uncultured Robinsoniella sp. TaxID=904190 RepID=UPI00374E8D07
MNYDKEQQELQKLTDLCKENGKIDLGLYEKYNVKRGLRDINGKGVLTGLTKISNIQSSIEKDGKSYPCEGKLLYRGIDVQDLVKGFITTNTYGYEETTYLLIFGNLPNQKELDDFKELLGSYRTLPNNFVRDVVMKAPNKDMMNSLAKSILTLSYYDPNSDDISVENVLQQSLKIISVMPMLAVYGYHAFNHNECDESLYIHKPDPSLSTAENLLRLLRPDKNYSDLEARVLDLALILHMEHGGGNNSTFTTHVVTSSGTDTYSAVAAALASLKGPKHGGANIKVVEMIQNLKETVSDWTDETQVHEYLEKLMRGEAFDRKGLIYGMGHAVYSISDPRAQVLKSFVKQLSEDKHREDDYKLYSMIETMAPRIIAGERAIYKGVSANVDFYSGFVYSMLDIPEQLFTPIFAIARIVGWSAHRLEELMNMGKIIRPAYKSVLDDGEFIPMSERK